MLKRAATTALAAVVLSAGGVVATSGPAAAAMGKGRAQICAKGSLPSWLVFEGGLEYQATYVAQPGKCIEATIPSGTYAIGVWFATADVKLRLHRFGANPSINPGVKVFVYGTYMLDATYVVTS